MRIAIPKERRPNEKRVAASPESVKKLIALGAEVVVEAGAGLASAVTDDAFAAAGAKIAPDLASTLADADVIFHVQRPVAEELPLIKRGATLIAGLNPYADRDSVKAYADAGIDAFAMELVPRITRAQSMDILSSQANLAGYRAVIEAAAEYSRAIPMMMTAAGTVAPARALIMGVGVAGLQAIATAKRLGAIVSATDVRPATKEQVESLGGTFIAVMDEEFKNAQTAGGYAKEMSKEYQAKQAALIADTIKKQDMVITTALIPGRPAPVLVSPEMVATMKPGSVIVDLAVEQGGNCPLSKPGETVVTENGVHIVGIVNLPSRICVDASQLFAKNLLNFITPLVSKETKQLAIDWDDEIIKASILTKGGAVVHPAFASA
ncbi:Re/Si-specific NAD(P)(+) transhydrogenase subunit alpha [Zavarzinia sp.]|uniref:Re/Si-specific NAD(P)(+) transhydrogenase subunit alpha n=1 Tax=Zavarzinia sp. TaxID=2027920 RepID=UPI003566A14C